MVVSGKGKREGGKEEGKEGRDFGSKLRDSSKGLVAFMVRRTQTE